MMERCPYCDTKVSAEYGDGGCEHFFCYMSDDIERGFSYSGFSKDVEIRHIDNPAKKQKIPNFQCSEETLKEAFGEFCDILDAYGWIYKRRSFNRRLYFQKLMEKTTCIYKILIHDEWPLNDIKGDVYFAEDRNDVEKKLKETILKVDQCFKRLKDIMKKIVACPYCGIGYKKKCEHYVKYTELVKYPKMPEKFRSKEWSKESLRNIFGDLYDMLDAYDKGFTEEPNRVVFVKKLLLKVVNCKHKHYKCSEGLVGFSIEPDKVFEQLNEITKRLSWLFKGLAYAEEIGTKGNTKSIK